MTMETARDFFLWCTVINYGVLLVWFLFFMLAHDWMYRFHGKWFSFTLERFDAMHYATMAAFKLGIILLNLVPLVAVCIIM
jgi:hypothetical protein